MGVYSDYLNNPRFQDPNAVTAERKFQLRRISEARRGSDILVFAADITKQIQGGLTSISYPDLLPITDQLSNLSGSKLDLILETPGGFGEVTEEIVRLIRKKYGAFSVIVPGWAKSAGTILAMAADDILMGPMSALGPIDAQLSWQGKQFSADALLEGLSEIKEEVTRTGALNKAYIPILQNISPGELQDAKNALAFATDLVTDWLDSYKFVNWKQHSSTGQPVTESERNNRAHEIAEALCDHRRWRTHGRSIKIDDLRAMKLKITDFTEQADLGDAVARYYALLQITFAGGVYKLYETAASQIMKIAVTSPDQQRGAGKANVDFQCNSCHARLHLQANFGSEQPAESGRILFPRNNKLRCPKCGVMHDLSEARRQLETQSKMPVV